MHHKIIFVCFIIFFIMFETAYADETNTKVAVINYSSLGSHKKYTDMLKYMIEDSLLSNGFTLYDIGELDITGIEEELAEKGISAYSDFKGVSPVTLDFLVVLKLKPVYDRFLLNVYVFDKHILVRNYKIHDSDIYKIYQDIVDKLLELFKSYKSQKVDGDTILKNASAEYYKHNYLPALSAFLYLHRKYPDNEDYVMYISKIYYNIRKHKKSIHYLEKIKSPDRRLYQIFWLCRNYYRLGYIRKAEKIINRFKKKYNDNNVFKYTMAQYYKNLADHNIIDSRFIFTISRKDYNKSLGMFEELLNCPDIYIRATELKKEEVYQYMGVIYEGLGEFDKAVEMHLKALEVNPDYDESLNSLGAIYSSRHENNKGIEYLKKAIEQNFLHEYTHNNLGQTYLLMGKTEDAVKEFKIALDINKDYLHPLESLYDIFSQLKFAAIAWKYGQRILELKPNDLSTWLNQIRLNYYLGNEDDEEMFNKFIETFHLYKGSLEGGISMYTQLKMEDKVERLQEIINKNFLENKPGNQQ